MGKVCYYFRKSEFICIFSGGCSILSELGSLELEFNYLSKATKNDTYSNKIKRIREVISSVKKPDGLYPNYINPHTGKWCQSMFL